VATDILLYKSVLINSYSVYFGELYKKHAFVKKLIYG